MQPAYAPRADGRVHVFDTRDLAWQPTSEAGIALKPVRYDNQHGLFLGLVHFAPLTRSGVHQHRGVATSFVASGGLTDYNGPIRLHEVGINPCGATHDATSYEDTVLVSRLEGPVIYPPERADLTGLHAGSRHEAFDNPAPDVPPEVNVVVDALQRQATGVRGIARQMIYDYAGSGSDHRLVQLAMAPGACCPVWRASAVTEFWIRGGLMEINGQVAHGNCFVVIEPGAEVRMASRYGALLLAWAEGPEVWLDSASATGPRAVRSSLYGFPALAA